MPIPKWSTLEFLAEIAEILFPDALFAEKHPAFASILLTVGTIIYGYLMLDDDNVDNWKTVLKLIAFWFIAATLGSGFAINSVHEGETFSKLFMLGMLTISVAYIVISIRSWWVRESCLVRGIATLIAIGRVAACWMWTQELIGS